MNDELGVDVDVGGQPAGLPSRTKPQGQDEKGAMAGTKVEPSKKTHGEITLDLSAAAGPAVEERQEDDQQNVAQEDRQEKKEGVGGGCFLFLLFWGTPKDMDLRNAYMYSLPRHLTV